MHIQPVFDLVARAGGLHKTEPIAARRVPILRADLHNVSVTQLVTQRNNTSVHLCPGAGVPYFGMNGVGKIDRRGFTRKDDNFALWREGINLLRIQIDLERGKELVWVHYVLLPFDHLSQPSQALLVARGNGRAILVFPVGRDPFLRHLVHIFRADLHLKGMPGISHHRGVQRLVEVGSRHGDEVLDASRHRTPHAVDGPQSGIAILD